MLEYELNDLTGDSMEIVSPVFFFGFFVVYRRQSLSAACYSIWMKHAAQHPREINMRCYRGNRKGGNRMPYNSKAFGIIVSRERVRNGMTQEQLSGLAQISRTHLAALESGKKVVKLDTLWRIAEALNIRPGRLVTMMEKEET
jgi:ribosome-binding protein aMBF1 (putative translation factor)